MLFRSERQSLDERLNQFASQQRELEQQQNRITQTLATGQLQITASEQQLAKAEQDQARFTSEQQLLSYKISEQQARLPQLQQQLRVDSTQLQTVNGYPGANPLVRVPHNAPALLKQILDIGAPTVLVPMVDTAEQAAAIVKACRYPQDDGKGGIRGMAGTRAARWGRYPNYGKEANAQVCVLVQAETREALKNLDAIAATPGVDGVFIGPADLSASMGHMGNPTHPEVQAAIVDAIEIGRAHV